MGYFLMALVLIALDQISKLWIVKNFKLFDTKPLINDIFHLTYVQNKGAAFSLLENQQWFFIIITLAAIGTLIYFFVLFYRKENYTLLRISMILVFSGAVGNFIDRIRLRYVIDFFDFRAINFAIFNVADSFVVVGAILLGYCLLFVNKELLR